MRNVTLWRVRVMFVSPLLAHCFTRREPIFGYLMSPATVAYLSLNVNRRVFLLDFKQLWILSTEFPKRPPYQISRNSVPWELRWNVRTSTRTDGETGGLDKRDEDNSRFSWLLSRPISKYIQRRHRRVHSCCWGSQGICHTS